MIKFRTHLFEDKKNDMQTREALIKLLIETYGINECNFIDYFEDDKDMIRLFQHYFPLHIISYPILPLGIGRWEFAFAVDAQDRLLLAHIDRDTSLYNKIEILGKAFDIARDLDFEGIFKQRFIDLGQYSYKDK